MTLPTALEAFSLAGRRAVVTGGNAGIGEAMATALGRAGAAVLLVARRARRTRCRRDPPATRWAWPATRSWPISAARGTCRRPAPRSPPGGAFDILVNAAGVNLREPFDEVSPESWDLQLALHLGAPFFLAQALAPGMAERGYGRIINIASLQSTRAFARQRAVRRRQGRRGAAHPRDRPGMVARAASPATPSAPASSPPT